MGPQVKLEAALGSMFEYPPMLSGRTKSRNSRNARHSGFVFDREDGSQFSGNQIDRQRSPVRTLLEVAASFCAKFVTSHPRQPIWLAVYYNEVDYKLLPTGPNATLPT